MRWQSIFALVLPALFLVGCGADTRYTLATSATGELTAMDDSVRDIKDEASYKTTLDLFTANVAVFKDLADRSKPLDKFKASTAKKLAKDIANGERNLTSKINSPTGFLKDNPEKHKKLKALYTKILVSIEILKKQSS
jgi:hypothetical protein